MAIPNRGLPARPPSNSIRFSRIHPAPPPLPPRPLHYSPRKVQIPAPLLPTSFSCSPPPTPSKRRASWILAHSEPLETPESALNAASVVMLTCGTILMFLCFLGIAESGRLYYLDTSLISGATYLIIGLLGLRTRYWTSMPNRNFVSGFIVLAILSFLMTADILAMLVIRNNKAAGSNSITDMLGGAACGIALLTVLVALVGLLVSRCCRTSPPDNRIGHCAEGLTL